uniref:Uncharacterized protein n=1 Tax=Arundo donax TaxID=35708 RepID=A0A0A8ZG19_ARUDO
MIGWKRQNWSRTLVVGVLVGGILFTMLIFSPSLFLIFMYSRELLLSMVTPLFRSGLCCVQIFSQLVKCSVFS